MTDTEYQDVSRWLRERREDVRQRRQESHNESILWDVVIVSGLLLWVVGSIAWQVFGA